MISNNVIGINVQYFLSNIYKIELPDGYTIEDIVDIWVKEDTLNISFKGIKEIYTKDLNSYLVETCFKRPDLLTIYSVKNDEIDFTDEILGNLT